MTSTEIELHASSNGHVAERDVVDGWLGIVSDVIKLANVIAPTDFVPAEYRDNPPAVAAAILAGRELGIGPMTSLRHVQLVKGVPTLSAEYKRARVLGAGHEFDVLELTTQRCKVSGRRRGSNKPPLEVAFSMDDAKTAGLLNPSRSGKPGAWQTRPRRMLFARAGSELCDFLFADVVNGLPTAELVGEGEDGFEGYNEPPDQPAKRTARRARTASAADPTPVSAAGSVTASGTTPPDAPAQTAPPARTNGDQPPLPGEDERPADDTPDDTDYDTPGTATRGKGGQLTAIWTVLSTVYGFGNDEKEHARKVCEHIIGRQLAGDTTANLSYNEARTVLDTLAMMQTVAEGNEVSPREQLIALLAESEASGA
jgi:hypothetical protein